MDEAMEADSLPEKLIPDEITDKQQDEGETSTAQDDNCKPAEGGNSVPNGDEGEQMETDEPPSVQGEAMETADEEPVQGGLEDVEKETDTENLIAYEENREKIDSEQKVEETASRISESDNKDDGEYIAVSDTVQELGEENKKNFEDNLDFAEGEINENKGINDDVLDLEEPLGETEYPEENKAASDKDKNDAENADNVEWTENSDSKIDEQESGEKFENRDEEIKFERNFSEEAEEEENEDDNAGDNNTDNVNAGDNDIGDDTGDVVTGVDDTGDVNADVDTGDVSTGDNNAGGVDARDDTEDVVSGDNNTGDNDTGDVSAGDVNIEDTTVQDTSEPKESEDAEEDVLAFSSLNQEQEIGDDANEDADATGQDDAEENNDNQTDFVVNEDDEEEEENPETIDSVQDTEDGEPEVSEAVDDVEAPECNVDEQVADGAEAGISKDDETPDTKADDREEDMDMQADVTINEEEETEKTNSEKAIKETEDLSNDKTEVETMEIEPQDSGDEKESSEVVAAHTEQEVTPSGDNSNQSESALVQETTPTGDNSNQSESVMVHEATPDDNSNQSESSEVCVATPSEATPTGDNSNQSEETSDKTSAEFDLSKVKIKKEKVDTTASEKGTESEDGVNQMKIVGVTSAVGVDDKVDNSVQSSVKDEKVDEKKMDIKDQVKVKQEVANVSNNKDINEETKKKLSESLKQKGVKRESKSGADDDVIEKKPTQKPKTSKIQTCIVCSKVGKCKYNIVRNGDVKHLCDDNCFKKFRSSPTTYLKQAETANQKKSETSIDKKTVPTLMKTAAQVKAAANQQSVAQPQSQVYKTCTVCQLMNVRTSKPFLNWQGLDYCGEECLGKYQASLSNNCSYCSGAIFPNNKAKYCCRLGSEVKHFCSVACNNEFVKRMKVCAFCSKDLAQKTDSFMAPVGETFKDFCSQNCLQQFEEKNNKDGEIGGEQKGLKDSKIPKGNAVCAVCGKFGPIKHEFQLDSKVNRLCSDPCFSAFQYANKLTLNTCDNCNANLKSDNNALQYVQFEGQQKRFCSYMCVNTFRNSNKKTVPCAWCGSKKSNFDMIERVDANNKYQLFCSLNCLSLYRVNLQATSNQAVVCDQCHKFVPAQYHLTMSDASVRNFCSYSCVMQFQAQFQTPAKQFVQQNTANSAGAGRGQQQSQQTTRSGRVVTKAPKVAEGMSRGGKKDADSFPIISNVVSLAPQGSQSGQQQINIKSSTPVTVTNQQQGIKATTTTTGNQTVQQQIIIQPPPPKAVKNKSLLCKPFTQTKATSCRPHTLNKETQSEGKLEPDKYLIPVPVPLYCPTPLAMYSVPTPVLIPVPIPIPVPVFIPTTKKSANSILKQIKEIREKIPADPLEAELLMMAEVVAGNDDESSSCSEDEDTTVPEAPPPKVTNTAAPAASGGSGGGGGSGDLGEDMLQMALRMASEMTDEPVMDLENSLEPVAVNTEPPPKPLIRPGIDEEDDYMSGARSRRSRGGNKRQQRTTPRRTPKRQKMEVTPPFRQPTPSPPPPAAPPPDANFHLKYTYGVNAFKHWVIQKNSQMEQMAKPGQKNLRTFKSDILQCTADELNFSLCLFVKEVRKPNGERYAVDSIYYLCLGIQQYLFENGRIDNIFSDFYYERFTEQLNEILTRYEPKLNHAGQLVCRIEEEHLWESKQLGAHSPHVLLNSLVYFNTKYFMLKTSEDHLRLSFTHIMKHWKKTANGRGSGTGPNAGRSVYLRYYCPAHQGKETSKKKKEEMPVYEQTENIDNPLRCPVKLYEFYLSKCPESIKNRNDTFYLVPERSCVPDSPVWYSTGTLGIDAMAKMLNRIRLVREIQEAHLHTQPIYI